jgi:hypothetical protein
MKVITAPQSPRAFPELRFRDLSTSWKHQVLQAKSRQLDVQPRAALKEITFDGCGTLVQWYEMFLHAIRVTLAKHHAYFKSASAILDSFSAKHRA